MKIGVPALFVLLLMLCHCVGAEASQGNEDQCPGHWHVGYSVWVEDQRLEFPPQGAAADHAASPGAGAHIHADDGLLHFHPGSVRCIGLDGPLEKLGVEVSASSLAVRDETHQENATHEVVVYHQPWGGDWGEIDDVEEFLSQQPGNGDRIMIAYMDVESTIGIQQRQQQTASLEGSNYEPGRTSAEGGAAQAPGGPGSDDDDVTGIPGLGLAYVGPLMLSMALLWRR